MEAGILRLRDGQFGWVYFAATMDAEDGRGPPRQTVRPAVSTIATVAFRRNAGLNFLCIVFGKLVKPRGHIMEPQCPPFQRQRASSDSQGTDR
jgi:hypothetical protein